MRFLHRFNLPARKHCSSRCFIPLISLLLLVAVLAASNVRFTFPDRRVPFPRPFSFHTRRGEACDIFRGEWVPDPDAPYYTNDTCSVIHEHYDCIRYGKPDLGFVKWRWRPDGCDLPRLDPARFLAVMRGKSMAFVGDSLARNHIESLICLLTRVAEPTPSWPSNKHTVFYYGEYNFTVANFWAPYLVRHEQIDDDGPAHTGLWNLYLDEPDAVWLAHVAEFDYVVVSASSWFYRPSMLYEDGRLVGCHYCLLPNVTDLTLRYALRMATRAALRALGGADGRFRGTAVLRTVSPSQYEGGEWNKDGNCVRTMPYQRGEKRIEGFELDFHTLQLEEFAAAERAARDAGGLVRMMLMDTTEAMILRADAHPSKYRGWTPEKHFTLYNDCVHWCLPGAVDTWNDMLLHMLTSKSNDG
ncbi:protein trichome birefringence-like 19 [Phragmites australis]|uniref:protein trichome birefringence-like 19 n=1 Tax=Phragmites australis TaxID=29695 RepID=UPI002D78DBD6|nr:protein trichome birefringence-like 19 [Phragmites australis]